jgi:hypothetical protein
MGASCSTTYPVKVEIRPRSNLYDSNILFNIISRSRNRKKVLNAFLKWQRFACKSKCIKLTRSNHKTSDRCASLFQEVTDLQQYIVSIEQNLNTSSSRSTVVENVVEKKASAHCVICFNEIESEDAVVCDENHTHCLTCIDKYCGEKLQSFSDDLILTCQCQIQCDKQLSFQDIIRCQNGRRLYDEHVFCQNIKPSLFKMLEITKDLEHFKIQLTYVRTDMTFKAYSCSKCGFGPIEHIFCDDLMEFHKKGETNNACPKCSHFVSEVTAMTQWDGTSIQH